MTARWTAMADELADATAAGRHAEQLAQQRLPCRMHRARDFAKEDALFVRELQARGLSPREIAREADLPLGVVRELLESA